MARIWPAVAIAVAAAVWLDVGGATAASETPTLLERSLPGDPQPLSSERVVGEIFGVPVSQGNYQFAKAVAWMFPRPWGASDLPGDQREDAVWESLILHYESSRRGIAVTDEALDRMVNELLTSQQQTFTRRGDPAAYRHWVTQTLKEPVEVLENQVRFLLQIRALKDQVRAEQVVTVTEEELRQEFLNEQHHVGGEIVTFETKGAAEAFYQQVKEPAQWEQMKAAGDHQVRPVNLMTLEAYMDLWSIPKDSIYAFHALPLGTIGPPMPFGTKQWCVYRLLEKRTGDLKDFPAQREAYRQQVTMKKPYDALRQWIEALKVSANRKIF